MPSKNMNIKLYISLLIFVSLISKTSANSELTDVSKYSQLNKIIMKSTTNLQKEIFKDIPGHKGSYQVSNLANIKSLERTRIHSSGTGTSPIKEKILKANLGTHNIVVDHIDGIKTNDYLINIQLISHRLNISKEIKNSTSNHHGVGWHNQLKKWRARIEINNKQIYLGVYENELDAAKVYQLAVNSIELFNGKPKDFRNKLKQSLCLQK